MQPAAIKSFLDKVLSTPEDQLGDVLEAFIWKADKVSKPWSRNSEYTHAYCNTVDCTLRATSTTGSRCSISSMHTSRNMCSQDQTSS